MTINRQAMNPKISFMRKTLTAAVLALQGLAIRAAAAFWQVAGSPVGEGRSPRQVATALAAAVIVAFVLLIAIASWNTMIAPSQPLIDVAGR